MFGPRPNLKRAATEHDGLGRGKIRQLRELQRTRSQDDVITEGNKRRMLGVRGAKSEKPAAFRRTASNLELAPSKLERSLSSEVLVEEDRASKVYRPSTFKTFTDSYRFRNPMSVLESLETDSQSNETFAAETHDHHDISDTDSELSRNSLEFQDIHGFLLPQRRNSIDLETREALSYFDHCLRMSPKRKHAENVNKENVTRVEKIGKTDAKKDAAMKEMNVDLDPVFITTPQSKKKMRQKKIDFDIMGSRVGGRIVTRIVASLPVNSASAELEAALKTCEKEGWDSVLSCYDIDAALSNTSKSVLQESIINWIYPTSRPSPAHSALISKILGSNREINPSSLKPYEQSELLFLSEQEAEWKTAFKSLFTLYNHNRVRYFYYTTADFALFFSRKSEDVVDVSMEKCVYVSKASPGLRKALETTGVKFKEIVPQSLRLLLEAPRMEEVVDDDTVTRGPSAETRGVHPDALLQIHAKDSIDRLYRFLLDRVDPRADHRVMNRPTLHSPSPFMHSATRKAKVTMEVAYKKIERDPRAYHQFDKKNSNNALSEFISLRVTGTLLPVQTRAILSIVKSCHLGHGYQTGDSGGSDAGVQIQYESQTEGFRQLNTFPT
ncbi:hypothetical protein BC829DRAFT_436730 [Chytridium lagenaria]|nr:hypothetical protein BC829DRAFT_436730 [Chytridium lagenaria]